jgi:magnesium transporter
LKDFEYCIKEFRSALEDVLNSEDDLNSISILGSSRESGKINHEDIELTLEYYLKRTEEIANEITVLQETIKSVEQNLDVISAPLLIFIISVIT